eukprot:12270359-Alexandrium_andersonii.AAC.1
MALPSGPSVVHGVFAAGWVRCGRLRPAAPPACVVMTHAQLPACLNPAGCLLYTSPSPRD